MEFQISRKHFSYVLRQILLGRQGNPETVVDLTADRALLTVAVTGTTAEVPITITTAGSASVPFSVITAAKKISNSYKDQTYRIRIIDGRFYLQRSSFSNDGISMKKIARRIIDIPESAHDLDLLSLPSISSLDEIEECHLLGKVLDAQNKLARALSDAEDDLKDYGISRNDLAVLAEASVKGNSVGLRRILFPSE